MHRALVVVVGLCACGTTPETTHPTTQATTGSTTGSAPPAPPASCADQVAHLGTQLAALAKAQPGFLPLVQGITAPVNPSGRPADARGIVIAITRDGAMFAEGTPLTSIAEARDYLDSIHKHALEAVFASGGTAADATLPLYIWADAATPASAIAALAGAIEPEPARHVPHGPISAEQQRTRQQAIAQARAAGIVGDPSKKPTPAFVVRLLVTTTRADPAPPKTELRDVPVVEPEATTYVVGQLKTAIGACAPVTTAFGAASVEGTPARQAAKLATDLPAALMACDCKVPSRERLEWGTRMWLGAWAPQLTWIELPAVRSDDQRPIGTLAKP